MIAKEKAKSLQPWSVRIFWCKYYFFYKLPVPFGCQPSPKSTRASISSLSILFLVLNGICIHLSKHFNLCTTLITHSNGHTRDLVITNKSNISASGIHISYPSFTCYLTPSEPQSIIPCSKINWYNSFLPCHLFFTFHGLHIKSFLCIVNFFPILFCLFYGKTLWSSCL